MCKVWSGIARRDGRCFSMGNDPSHDEILFSAGLKDDTADKDEMAFARVEIVPPGGDYSLPLSKWEFKVDEQVRPTWLAGKHEVAARRALKSWAKEHIIRKGDREVRDGEFLVFVGRSTGEVSDGKAWFYDQSTGEVSGGETQFHGESTGEISGGEARFYDQSTGEVSGGEAQFHDQSAGTVSGGEARFHGEAKQIIEKGKEDK